MSSMISPVALPIVGDRIQLQQVILNLVVNAIDAMADTPGDDRVISIRTSRDEKCAEIAISDRGPGIPDRLTEVFEPFVTNKPKGMGMGYPLREQSWSLTMVRYPRATSPDGCGVPDQDFPPSLSSIAFGPAVRWIAQLPCDIGRERPIPDCTILTTPGSKLRQQSKIPNPTAPANSPRRRSSSFSPALRFPSFTGATSSPPPPSKEPGFPVRAGELSAQRRA